MKRIDINCDLGEGCAQDRALMPYISSASIACGLHAGDALSMQSTLRACLEHGVAIGAHPSFDDRAHFGRRELAISSDDLRALLRYQIGALRCMVEAEGARLRHVKPHGALYNLSAREAEIARIIAEEVAAIDGSLCLYGLAGSASIEAARAAGLMPIEEAFAERRYEADGRLSPRSLPDAVIDDHGAVLAHTLHLVRHSEVRARTGETLPLQAHTLCLHGDRSDVLQLAAAVHGAITAAGVQIAAPAGPSR